MKNLAIVIMVLVLIGGGGYLAYTMMQDSEEDASESIESTEDSDQVDSDDESEEATDEAESTNEVSYGDDGFSPASITVEVGTKVTWTNESASDMWVASDPHPVHTDFSSFDQKESGTSYSFSFDKAGTYEYHNHLSSGDTGKVIVK